MSIIALLPDFTTKDCQLFAVISKSAAHHGGKSKHIEGKVQGKGEVEDQVQSFR
jgi:hypothetical protein